MRGLIYRLGVWIKERGERAGHVKMFNIFIFNRCAGAAVRFGLKIREFAVRM